MHKCNMHYPNSTNSGGCLRVLVNVKFFVCDYFNKNTGMGILSLWTKQPCLKQ